MNEENEKTAKAVQNIKSPRVALLMDESLTSSLQKNWLFYQTCFESELKKLQILRDALHKKFSVLKEKENLCNDYLYEGIKQEIKND